MIANSIKAQLDEAEHVIRQLMARIAELEAEVAALKANADAHQTLKNIYANPAEPTGHRIRAAQAALNVETPRLVPQPPVLDLIGEHEPLAVVVERQRARLNLLLGPSTDQASPSNGVGGDDNSD